MRILHTSDWHLGRSLYRADLRDAQAAMLDHLVEVAAAERVDAVLVAGDVYDRAVPSLDAVQLCEDALARLAGTGARVVVISGNHDSAIRLGFGSRLMDAAGVHVRTDLAGVGRPVMFADADGEVAVYPLPYLEPNTAGARLPDPDAASDAASESESAGLAGAGGTGPPERGLPPAVGPVDQSADQGPALPSGAAGSAVGGDVPRGHVATLRRAMACVRADLCSRPAARSVVVAHAWVAGAAPSDSERDISVGGVGAVPVDVFDGIDYVALGHLHRPQAPGPRLRYSGSPLPYSFSEAHQVKGSWIVRMDARGNVRADQVAAPVHRRLSVLSGTLDQLLAESAYDEYRDDFLAVVLRDQIRPQEPMTRLRTRFPHALTLEWRPDDALVDGHDTYAARVRGRGDEQIAGAFVEHVSRRPPTAGERELLAAAFDAQRAEAADTRPSHDGDLREEVAAHPLVSPGERSGEAA